MTPVITNFHEPARPIILVCFILFLLCCFSCRGNSPAAPEGDASKYEFVFPLQIGTTWTYEHFYNYYYAFAGESEAHHGIHIWQVANMPYYADSIVYTMLYLKQDTVRQKKWISGTNQIIFDTTFFRPQTNTFAVVAYADSFVVRWSPLVATTRWDPTLFDSIRRFSVSRVDTISRIGNFARAMYVNGVGLVSYSCTVPAHLSYTEDLLLREFSKK